MPQASGYLQIAEQSSVLSGRQDAALYGSQDGRRYAKHIQTPALLLGINARADPIEVALVARGDGQHDELRRVVRMFGNDEFLDRFGLVSWAILVRFGSGIIRTAGKKQNCWQQKECESRF